jgi:hypothetical protein
MTSRRRLVFLAVLAGIANLGAMPQALARGAGVGHGFVGHPPGAHVSGSNPSPAIRQVRTRAVRFRTHSLRQPAYVGLPWLMGYSDQGTNYDPYGSSAALPDEGTHVDRMPALNQFEPIAAVRPGCRSTQQIVPAESGGTRTVSITRCY